MMQDEPPSVAADDSGIASELIKARNELGLTQAQLAERSRVSRSAIKGYETGRNMPGARELKALCRVLRVSPTALLYGSEQAFKDQAIFPGNEELAGFDLDIGRARWRLHAITKLLALEEVAALSQLARSIAVARHGVVRVNDVARIGDVVGALATTDGAKIGESVRQIEQFVSVLDSEEAAHKAAHVAREPSAGA